MSHCIVLVVIIGCNSCISYFYTDIVTRFDLRIKICLPFRVIRGFGYALSHWYLTKCGFHHLVFFIEFNESPVFDAHITQPNCWLLRPHGLKTHWALDARYGTTTTSA